MDIDLEQVEEGTERSLTQGWSPRPARREGPRTGAHTVAKSPSDGDRAKAGGCSAQMRYFDGASVRGRLGRGALPTRPEALGSETLSPR